MSTRTSSPQWNLTGDQVRDAVREHGHVIGEGPLDVGALSDLLDALNQTAVPMKGKHMAGKLNKSQFYTILWQWKEDVDNGVQTVQLSEQQATNAERAISKLRRELADEYTDIGKADVIIFEVKRGVLDIDTLREGDESDE